MIKIKWLILFFLFPISAFGSLSSADKAHLVHKNIMDNGGFENGQSRWTESAGTEAIVTSGTNLLIGSASATWDAAATSDTYTYNAIAIPNGLKGRNGLGSCLVQTPSGTATHKLQVTDGTNILSEVDVVSSASPVKSDVSFIFPSSGNVVIRLEAQANEPLIAIDDCYLGAADNLVHGMPQDMFSAKVSSTDVVTDENVDWIDGDCTDATTGEQTCVFVSGFFSATPNCQCTLQDTGMDCGITSISATGLTTLTRNGAAAALNLNTHISCQKTGVDAVEYIKPDTSAQSWSGSHNDDCDWSQSGTSYVLMTGDATCTFEERTNTNFGTVTSASDGNNQPGITFTLNAVKKLYVCATFSSYNTTTNANADRRLWDGTTVISSTTTQNDGTGDHDSITLCGFHTTAAGVSNSLSLQAKSSSGTDHIGTAGTPGSTIVWNIFAIDQQLPAPLLVNSVVSSYSGVMGIESATVDASDVVTQESGDWLDGDCTNATTGLQTCTFKAGAFSSAPNCSCTPVTTGNGDCTIYSISSTVVETRSYSSATGTAGNQTNTLFCHGPR